jgi:hypothetical protein
MGTSPGVVALTVVLGSGLRCDGCRQPITNSQVECRSAGARLHQWCYYARSMVEQQSSAAPAHLK